ncbi:thiol-disulfide isomerase/thioredoxin [Weissella uvarum]|uniref:hypothetical protein n=1 Tax=Weissella uvarum TaxID=1479233 RepID=UPI001961C6B2|nr:hypothetical protein [Weissella uvarum]MBM7617383.1 thiol-disulfide isomerase/thioredoxin [Weissella uvarum]MCM0595731.1 hypothetical protein [Weissella uvarum]
MANYRKSNSILDMTWKQCLLLIIILLVFLDYEIGQYNKFLRSNRNVPSTQIKKGVKNNKSVVFYRDDCTSCRKALSILLVRNLFKKDLVLVNMNGSANKNYKTKYKLTSVPTIMNNNGNFDNLPTNDYIKAIQAVEKTDSNNSDLSNATDITIE